MSKRIKLSILGISYSQVQAGAYALIFAEEEGIRRLPVIIGSPEAQSIAIAMEGIVPPRPLSHDLMYSIFEELQIELIEVMIYKFENGAFSAEVLLQQDDRMYHFDARTSDAVALALRTNSPIYTTEEIMRNMAVVFRESDPQEKSSCETIKNDDDPEHILEVLSEIHIDALKKRLEEALQEEDYELATWLRDEINRRNVEE